jgi:hypothetical protein
MEQLALRAVRVPLVQPGLPVHKEHKEHKVRLGLQERLELKALQVRMVSPERQVQLVLKEPQVLKEHRDLLE